MIGNAAPTRVHYSFTKAQALFCEATLLQTAKSDTSIVVGNMLIVRARFLPLSYPVLVLSFFLFLPSPVLDVSGTAG